jgi:hypothetical protein
VRIVCKRLSHMLPGILIALGIGLDSAAAQQGLLPPRAAKPPLPALAQQMAQTPPGAQTPQRTTATYDDWVLRCDVQPGPPTQKICDMAQLTQVQGQANPMSRVAIGRPAKAEPVKLLVQLPVNVSLAAGVRIPHLVRGCQAHVQGRGRARHGHPPVVQGLRPGLRRAAEAVIGKKEGTAMGRALSRGTCPGKRP